MIEVSYEKITEFEGGAVYWVSWKFGDKTGGKMVTLYENDKESGE